MRRVPPRTGPHRHFVPLQRDQNMEAQPGWIHGLRFRTAATWCVALFIVVPAHILDSWLDRIPAREDGAWRRYGDWGCRWKIVNRAVRLCRWVANPANKITPYMWALVAMGIIGVYSLIRGVLDATHGYANVSAFCLAIIVGLFVVFGKSFEQIRVRDAQTIARLSRQLSEIHNHHVKAAGDYCAECGWLWPCGTRRWTEGVHDQWSDVTRPTVWPH